MRWISATALLLMTSAAWTAEPPQRPELARTAEALRRGLQYLAKTQTPDGSWPEGQLLGVKALAVTALLADGNLPDEGEYAEQVRRGLDHLLKAPKAKAPVGVLLGTAESPGQMYEHGFTMLALAEAHGMTRDPRLRSMLADAIKLSEYAQAADGGWDYTPSRRSNDISLSVAQLMGLRAARNGGLFVSRRMVEEQGLKYVRSCFDRREGGFGYTPGSQATFNLTACGVVALQVCGKYSAEDEQVRRGLEFLAKHVHDRRGHFFYGTYYAAQACFQAGGKYWEETYPQLVVKLLAAQKEDGRWYESNNILDTSMAAIVLAMPKRYLPVFVQEHKARW